MLRTVGGKAFRSLQAGQPKQVTAKKEKSPDDRPFIMRCRMAGSCLKGLGFIRHAEPLRPGRPGSESGDPDGGRNDPCRAMRKLIIHLKSLVKNSDYRLAQEHSYSALLGVFRRVAICEKGASRDAFG